MDYDATVWANGVEVGRHRGGFTPFTCDLSGVAAPGETVTIVVRARDYRQRPQPRGKQSDRYGGYGCLYTRTTGIWQTVWLEPVPDVALRRPRLTPDLARGVIRLEQPLSDSRPGYQLRATLSDDAGRRLHELPAPPTSTWRRAWTLAIPAARRHLWSPGDPFLYDLTIELLDEGGRVVDRADELRRAARHHARPGRPSRSTASRSSSAWCSTRASIPTAS